LKLVGKEPEGDISSIDIVASHWLLQWQLRQLGSQVRHQGMNLLAARKDE
jgi:hypothetical protein